MDSAVRENVDLFEVSQQQFDRALTWADDLKTGVINCIRAPRRTTHVRS
jgi:hypothetical protein